MDVSGPRPPPPPRTIVQDVLTWYMSHLDPYAPHIENIQRYLKGPILSLTVRILFQDPKLLQPSNEEEHEEEKKQQHQSSSSYLLSTCTDWNEFTRKNSNGAYAEQHEEDKLWNEKGQEAFDSLSRRSKARMEAFLEGCILAVTNDLSDDVLETTTSTTKASLSNKSKNVLENSVQYPNQMGLSLSDGLSAFRISSSTKSKSTTAAAATTTASTATKKKDPATTKTQPIPIIRPYPQIPHDQLWMRLELYVRSLHRIRTLSTSEKESQHQQKDDQEKQQQKQKQKQQQIKYLQECVVAMEPPKWIKARAKCLVTSFVTTAGCVQSVSPILTRLVTALTKEVLAVDVVSPELKDHIIPRIVIEYEHGTSFASLAFLSTPEASADTTLTPLIVKYLKYLQKEWESLIQGCELEHMLQRALDPRMRQFFKTIEFQSIGHLLELCHHLQPQLSSIELAPTVCVGTDHIHNLSHSTVALRQALLDLQREVITVNGHVLPPVTSRSELIRLLSQTLNSRTITAMEQNLPGTKKNPPTTTSTNANTNTKKKGKKKSKNSSRNGVSDALSDDSNSGNENLNSNKQQSPTVHANKNNKKHNKHSVSRTMPTPIHQSLEDDVLFSSEYESSDAGGNNSSASSVGGTESITKTSPSNSSLSQRSKRRRRRNFQLSTIDVLTRRLLIAASRTGTSGDAYFIVRDLFGGEDVEVVPSTSIHSRYSSSSHHHHHRNGAIVRPGTIDIMVRLASVTIKCHSSFDVYPKSLVGECEPLIQFHTTTTETIALQEVRSTTAEDSSNGTGTKMGLNCTYSSSSSDEEDEKDEHGNKIRSIWMVQERQTPKTGWRTISIRPALYERIEQWHSPS